MDNIQITNEKLDVNDIYSGVVAHSTGAVSLFVGTTRDNFEGKKVIQLEYEAFVPMAEKELKKICVDLRDKWKVENIAFYHRLGLVPVGEASVVVAISSTHRSESLDAVRYAIDSLKERVPIWKKEVYDQGSEEWKANSECSWAAIKSNEEDREENTLTKRRKTEISAEYIRIKASKTELDKRIAAFTDWKRAESDVANVQEFCHRLPLADTENSCARTESVLITRKDSKSHLKVSRVVNAWGPQTRNESAEKNVSKSAESNNKYTPALQERLENMEQHLGIYENQPIPADIYVRMKALEDSILYLESVSPEYFDGDFRTSRQKDEEVQVMNQIDQRIAELRNKMKAQN